MRQAPGRGVRCGSYNGRIGDAFVFQVVLLKCFHGVGHLVVIVAETGDMVERFALMDWRGLNAADDDAADGRFNRMLGTGIGVADIAEQFTTLYLGAKRHQSAQ